MKKHILVIEDTAAAAILIEATLKKNYDLAIAKTLVQARRELTSKSVDLVVLDASLPDGDGFSFCTWLQGDNRYKNIPVIFLTARSEPEEQEYAMTLGAKAYLTKPLKPTVLRQTIEDILGA